MAISAADQFLAVAEVGGDIAWVIDLPGGALRYLSAQVAQLSGFTAAEWADPASGAAPLLHALMAGLPARLSRFGAGDRSRQQLVRELELVHREGHKVPVEIVSRVLADDDGTPHSLVGIVRDVSRRREYEAGQRHFASMLNHEFRTPLSTIDGAIQRLQVTGAQADQPTLDRYRKIAGAVDQMIGMLERYLSPDIVAASGTTPRVDRVNPRRLLEEAAQAVRAAGRQASLALGDLPDTMRAQADGLRLAVKVLTDNALQYGPPDEPIALSGNTVEGGIVLTVRDRGAGVPAGEEETIFRKSVRGSNSKGLPGSGLGLYMARSVVEVHGGVLALQQEVTEGACFAIFLPLRVSAGKEVASGLRSSDNSGNKF